ncbi:chemotaxis protein CheW [Paenibacillus crassostreae]|uniref:Chemotaxis protein CheW n=1 Tax=Paenibacillus crassostreae TaxID=1763538 RepID=A0A162RHN7_9BACL|nr:chemotaxis protein CheW [Paenibacillus crassostreae]AOZ93035.1 chemotaxis protein CheW [Paenibacillus crassostreae]OAB71877.1 chemotaxis protein CheW [Paenibacillus crassostreae]
MQIMGQEQYIEFAIEEERYAIPIQDIFEIIKIQDITQIPNVTSYVEGVINLRGKIVPVISLRSFFGLREKENSKLTRIIVVHHQEDTVGVIVDCVNKVTTFTDIQPPPERIGGIEGSYFVGIGLTDNGIVGVLKLNEILLHD